MLVLKIIAIYLCDISSVGLVLVVCLVCFLLGPSFDAIFGFFLVFLVVSFASSGALNGPLWEGVFGE